MYLRVSVCVCEGACKCVDRHNKSAYRYMGSNISTLGCMNLRDYLRLKVFTSIFNIYEYIYIFIYVYVYIYTYVYVYI